MSVFKVSPLSTALGLVTSPVRTALFDLRVTAALLVAILYYPEKLQQLLPTRLHAFIFSPATRKTLKLALTISISRAVNNKLSQYAVNNWKNNAKFIKSQEVVLITGGSSGIGKLMADEFAQKGVKVVILDINAPKEALPSNVYFYRADVTSSADISSAAIEIRKNHGDPTILINNAGVGTGATILGGTEASIRKTFEVNTLSHFIMIREFLPSMIKKDKGHVVTIASMASFMVYSGNVDYSCTKASALAFHEGLATELKTRYNAPNVKTTIVHPSWIRTPMTEQLKANPKFKDPIMEPEYVASAVVKQVVSGTSGQLVLPEHLSLVSLVRSWPSWLQTLARNAGAHKLEDGSLS